MNAALKGSVVLLSLLAIMLVVGGEQAYAAGTLTATTTVVTCSPPTIATGGQSTCTVTVTGSSPTGSVTLSSSSSTGIFTPSAVCTLSPVGASSATCSVYYSDTTPGTATIEAAYSGDSNNAPSSGPFPIAVKMPTTTTVSCSPAIVPYEGQTTCTATVTGFSPAGDISWSSDAAGIFTPQTCSLMSSTCSVLYMARSPAGIVADYSGDANNLVSSGTFILQMATVNDEFQLTVANGGPTTSIQVSGCGASPTSIMADGASHLVQTYQLCSPVVLTLPQTVNTKYASPQSAGSFTIQPCVVGTCPTFSVTIYYQLSNTYEATPSDPSTWTTAMAIPVMGTVFGTADQTVCSISVSAGGGLAQCQGWSDYNTPVTVANLPVTPSERWATTLGSVTDLSGGNQHTATFFEQYLDSFQYSVIGSSAASTQAPTLDYTSFGVDTNLLLSQTTASSLWLDADTTWSVPQSLTGSNASERWATSVDSGTVNAGQGFSLFYYQQYFVTFAYFVAGNSSGFGLPAITLVQFDAPFVGQRGWADAGSIYNFTNPLPGSTATSRWFAASSLGTVSRAMAISATYYHQYAFVLSFAVIGGGTFGTPDFSSTSLGSHSSQPLYGTVSTYWVDSASAWSVNQQLPDSNMLERWITAQATTGSATSPVTVTFVYYHQYLDSVSYSVIGGGSPGPPVVTRLSLGSSSNASVGLTPAFYWFDAGTKWTSPPVLAGNATERWATDIASGTVDAAKTAITLQYYRQYSVGTSYSVAEGGAPKPPLFTSRQFGANVSVTVSKASVRSWFDSGAPWQLPKTLVGPASSSSQSERWATVGQTSGLIEGPLSVGPTYFHQYLLMVDYSIFDGGSPTGPAFNSSSFAEPLTTTVGLEAQGVWADAGSLYSFTNPLQGSTKSERWWTTSAHGEVLAAASLNISYYHQVATRFLFELAGGGEPPSPVVSYLSSGGRGSTSLTNGSASLLWLDHGSYWNVTDTLQGQSAAERWQSAISSGSVLESDNHTLLYYHQYLITASYEIVGGGSPEPPEIESFQLGRQAAIAISTTPTGLWLDSGSNYTITNLLPSVGNPGERWAANATASGTTVFHGSVRVVYAHQFRLSVAVSPPEGGSVLSTAGWYASGEKQTVRVFPNSGWMFWQWEGTGDGSYGGEASSASVVMLSPVNETAYLYPGVTISATGPGAVVFSYGQVTGIVPQGGNKTLFVPPGTNVTLSASPSSAIYGLSEWQGAGQGTGPVTSFIVNGPVAVTSVFGINSSLVVSVFGSIGTLVILGLVIVGVSGSLFAFLRRPARDRDLSQPEGR